MPTPTYTPLANLTLGSSQATITFSSISQSYRDIVLVVSGTGTASNINGIFNGDTTATNYARITAYGDGSSTASGAANNNAFMYFQSSKSIILCHVMDYSATNKHKSVLVRTTNSVLAEMTAAKWANTAAITSFAITNSSGTFASGTTFALYGIAS